MQEASSKMVFTDMISLPGIPSHLNYQAGYTKGYTTGFKVCCVFVPCVLPCVLLYVAAAPVAEFIKNLGVCVCRLPRATRRATMRACSWQGSASRP